MQVQYIFYYIIVFLLILIVSLGWFLSFQVPVEVRARDYLIQNHLGGLLGLVVLLTALVLVLTASFIVPSVVHFHAPFSQAGVFFVAISILLLSSFFIGGEYSGRRYDTHPLLFILSCFFIILAIITGVITNYKLFNGKNN